MEFNPRQEVAVQTSNLHHEGQHKVEGCPSPIDNPEQETFSSVGFKDNCQLATGPGLDPKLRWAWEQELKVKNPYLTHMAKLTENESMI